MNTGVILGLSGLLETPETAGRYQKAKLSAAMAVTESKTRAWEELNKALENDFWVAAKEF